MKPKLETITMKDAKQKYIDAICPFYRNILKNGFELKTVFIQSDSNFNLYILTSDTEAYTLTVPKPNTGCKTSVFGDIEYLQNYLAGKLHFQTRPVQYTEINF